jgi:hypothetical protein
MPSSPLPEFHESSIVAVRLLQGVVYSEDEKTWSLLLSHQRRLENQFARFGLLLICDEGEGFAYLRQMDDDECPPDYAKLPTLVRKSSLGYPLTILCILLRDHLRCFDAEEVHDERCVVPTEVLFDEWKTFFLPQHDEVKQRREFASHLRKAADDLGFIKKFSEEPETWEIRKILRARLPIAELENLHAQLIAYAHRINKPSK